MSIFKNKSAFYLTLFLLSAKTLAAEEICNISNIVEIKAIIDQYKQGALTTNNSTNETCSTQIKGIDSTKYNDFELFALNNSHFICNALSQSFRRQFSVKLKICNVSNDTAPKYRIVSIQEFSNLREF
ncbi:hypothetical protein [Enterobacter cancerogenus]|uniref:hypothetical protein n=1 Tax=Enterobacter cancerogenus TaxID=69218 RepID=UPI004058D29B